MVSLNEIREEVMKYSIKIDNYITNVTQFYDHIPFFYDKSCMFWIWNNKIKKYEMVDETDMMNLLDTVLGLQGQTVSRGVKTNYLEAFKRIGRKHIPEEAPKKWIQFKDKAFSLKSGSIYEITPAYFFTNPIPWEIGQTSETPIMDKLFIEWVGEKYVQTLYEIIAYCCLTEYPIHLIFCLVGCGRNGKSKFQGLLNNFIGTDNICSTELDILLDSRFESFKLYKKLLCSMGETNFGIISKTSLLKKLTGQDLIGFEFKNKKPFDDYNYAKILISSNSLPTTEDTSEGFYRRWMIVDFPNSFPEGKDILKIIPNEEYNNLARKVCDILPGLLERGGFTNQGSIQERKDKYIMSSNPLGFFINKYCNKSFSEYMRYSELYVAYRKYLNVNKKRAISYKEFNEVLALEGLEIQKTSKKVNEEWVNGRFIVGVSLKVGWDDDLVPVVPVVTGFPLSSPVMGLSEINRTTATKVTKTQKSGNSIQEPIQVELEKVNISEVKNPKNQKSILVSPQKNSFDQDLQDLKLYIETKPKDNANKIEELFSEQFINKCKEEGLIAEYKNGTYTIVK